MASANADGLSTEALPIDTHSFEEVQSDTETDAPNAAVQAALGHRFSKKTTTNYLGHVQRALKYAAEHDDPEWKTAFTTLSPVTPTVLLAFIASKCGQSGYSFKTAEGIRSAMKRYFQEKLGCQGDTWHCDNGKCTGNPVFEPAFSDYYRSLRNRDAHSGVSKQSLAISYLEMTKLMSYLQNSATIDKEGEGLCLLFQAFAATGFVLWTRNEELLNLQGKNLERNLVTDSGSPYFTIALSWRKTNQADASKANIYEIHPRPDEPDICCYTKLQAWLAWLERNGRPLQPDDYVFPALDGRGRVKLKERFPATHVQTLLDQFTEDAELLNGRNGRFTAHCFRRGGAQYRFMFAKEKWSLKAVKWWGGWSEGEKMGTIMRYLLDEFSRYETGFSDMLSPLRQDSRHAVFMGDTDTPGTNAVTQQALAIALEAHKATILKEMEHSFHTQTLELEQRLFSKICSKRDIQDFVEQLRMTLGNPDADIQPLQPLGQGSNSTQQDPREASQEPFTGLTPDPQQPTQQPMQHPIVATPAVARMPTIRTWQEAVKQWESGDPDKGLNIPLHAWTIAMRQTDAARFSQRKLIAAEFNYLGRNARNMVDVHGTNAKRIRTLIKSIRIKNDQRRDEARERARARLAQGREHHPLTQQEEEDRQLLLEEEQEEDVSEEEDRLSLLNEEGNGLADKEERGKEVEGDEEEEPLIRNRHNRVRQQIHVQGNQPELINLVPQGRPVERAQQQSDQQQEGAQEQEPKPEQKNGGYQKDHKE
ncbi:hypothetical protein BGZ72_008847 [Mortierella alpina]|nr:hypothetical protein BGZ72_008847 [Mortierella alpina]